MCRVACQQIQILSKTLFFYNIHCFITVLQSIAVGRESQTEQLEFPVVDQSSPQQWANMAADKMVLKLPTITQLYKSM